MTCRRLFLKMYDSFFSNQENFHFHFPFVEGREEEKKG